MDQVSRARALVEALSSNEREYLRGLVRGDSQRALADRLDMNHEEAVQFKDQVMRKIGAETTADAVRVGIYAGL